MDLEPPSYLTFFSTLDTNLIFVLVLIVLLLFCSALVSGAEVVFFSLTDKDIKDISIEDYSKSLLIQSVLRRPKKLLATLQLANNGINIAVIILFFHSSDFLFPAMLTSSLRFVISIGLLSFMILLFGEVLPKVYATKNKIKFAKFIVFPLSILNKALTPISMPMRAVILFLHEKLSKQKSNFSVNQLSQALELTSSEGTSHGEQKILEGIVSFGNTDTKQVMSPRIDIFALEIEEKFNEILPKIIEKEFSRIPVYRDNIDHIEGVLFVKDLIPYIENDDFNWKSLLRAPFFVPENKKLDDLLKDFQSMKSHLAIVVDEYGGTSGLVSLEDVIEEIVGDISDEFDGNDSSFTKIDNKNFLFEGKMNLKDFYRIVNVDTVVFDARKGEAETLAGFILEIIGNFPKNGQKITFMNCLFLIEEVDKKRIKQIKVTIE